jgi:hypothetical protein
MQSSSYNNISVLENSVVKIYLNRCMEDTNVLGLPNSNRVCSSATTYRLLATTNRCMKKRSRQYMLQQGTEFKKQKRPLLFVYSSVKKFLLTHLIS